MDTVVINAVMKRYGNLSMLYEAMNECEDTVLVNLSDDVNCVYTEDEILRMINLTI